MKGNVHKKKAGESEERRKESQCLPNESTSVEIV